MIIDVHQHWVPKDVYDNPEKYIQDGSTIKVENGVVNIYRDGVHIGPLFRDRTYDLNIKLADMNEAGIDKVILHTSVFPEWITLESARFINDEMARVVSEHPDRFIGLAHVPVEGQGAFDELERAVKVLGLKGVGLITQMKGLPLDSKRMWPLYQKVVELDVPIVIHPAPHPSEYQLLKDYNLARSVGRAYDLTLAVSRLLSSNTFDRFPTLKFCVAHLGGESLSGCVSRLEVAAGR